MDTKDRLEFCKKCLHRNLDYKHGWVCSLTGNVADFEGTCENFKLDESVTKNETNVFSNKEINNELDASVLNKLREHQDFYYASVGGFLATLIGAFIWAVITVKTEHQNGYMAVGIGLLVGFTIQFFGAGIDKKFGFLGAFLSLLGCLLGNLFTQVGFIAEEQSLGYFETLSYLNLGIIINIFIETFDVLDVLFYGLAIYEGYKFSFRKVSVQDIINAKSDTYVANQSNFNLRLPLVIVSIVLIGFFFIKIRDGVTGTKTYKYESGNKMSEGEMIKSKEQGKWTYWYENGDIQLIGYYSDGLPDSLWQWYYESGSLSRIGNYKKGLEHGIWINYYTNGNVSDSGNYYLTRMDGEWKYRFENGNLYQIGNYKRSLQEGVWKTFYENGQLNSVGEMKNGSLSGLWTVYYENGQLASKIKYLSNNKSVIEDIWDLKGNQIITNGNGIFKSFSTSGKILVQGQVKDGLKVGKWITYFENGDINEEGNFTNEVYTITNSWNSNGEQTIIDGQGLYKTYYEDNESTFETGTVVNGLREGLWETYYETTKTIYIESNYIKGKLSGIQKYYFESGQLYSSGEMKDGLKEGEWIWYYENGNISSTAKFINDKKEGQQVLWNEAGEKTKEEYYKNGELEVENVI
jgi:antitoxin component YwqK of YwqJK toxin-antitoxin module